MNRSDHTLLKSAPELASWLAPRMATLDPRGYVPGKTQIRDYLCTSLGCSQLEAEQAVEELVLTGALEFEGDPTTAGFEPTARWVVRHADSPLR